VTRLSLSDKQMISELERGREQLLSEPSSRSLLSNLRRKLQSISRNIYVFHWIPEQTEDLYDVLVDGVTVVHIEIPRGERGKEVVFEKWGIQEYLSARKQLTKPDRRKLELALRLAQEPHRAG
jgi:hypothetical protein